MKQKSNFFMISKSFQNLFKKARRPLQMSGKCRGKNRGREARREVCKQSFHFSRRSHGVKLCLTRWAKRRALRAYINRFLEVSSSALLVNHSFIISSVNILVNVFN